MRDLEPLIAAHRYSSHHRALMERSQDAGCFYCLQTFHPSDVMEWIPEPDPATDERVERLTALCPRCGIDAVLPGAAPVSLERAFLSAMHKYWFAAERPQLAIDGMAVIRAALIALSFALLVGAVGKFYNVDVQPFARIAGSGLLGLLLARLSVILYRQNRKPTS